MRLAASRREQDFEINAIPLIDVLLTLLMFFVLTTTFVQQAGMQVTLPQAAVEAASEPAGLLVITIDRDGRYLIEGNEVLNPGVDSLRDAIQRAAGGGSERPVQLRADALTPHQAVVTAMEALGGLGFARVSIATTPPAGSGRQ